ncbi:hypothetical protein CAEBREN_21130 [Caenorhabditis brenneri]|uniref:Uncharacterized protein n=1 Tax=Caenorhabditis brenneri TaxID=135651 RepID=G0NXH0_CAEBE|nr:hypothetical protein CAEBREN_21130 [Caenorhabditis brenneri]
MTTTENLTSPASTSSTPQMTTTTEPTSTSTVTTTTSEEIPSTTTIPTTTTELTTTTEIPTTTTEKNLCPHGFYDRCKQTCGCLDLAADTERLNKIYNKFSVEFPQTYVNATLEWAECLRVDMVSCSEGTPVVVFFDRNASSLTVETAWNLYSGHMNYECVGTNWISRDKTSVGYEAYYSCKLE